MHIAFDAVVEALKAAIPIAKQIAAFTASKWDDTAVAVAEGILNNKALLDFFHSLFDVHEVVTLTGDSRTAAIHAAMEAEATPDLKDFAAAAGFDWKTLLEYVPQIITLVLTLLGYRR